MKNGQEPVPDDSLVKAKSEKEVTDTRNAFIDKVSYLLYCLL